MSISYVMPAQLERSKDRMINLVPNKKDQTVFWSIPKWHLEINVIILLSVSRSSSKKIQPSTAFVCSPSIRECSTTVTPVVR
jgi:hypothetical protein